VLHADVDGKNLRRVPVLGDQNSSVNPRRQRACDLISVNHDGSRATVDLVVGNGTDGDIGGTQAADAVIETATGKVRALPVSGRITQALFQTDGRLLVESEKGGKRTLTLFSADDRVLATMAAPAAVKGLVLQDYAG
jgi:TolB protein